MLGYFFTYLAKAFQLDKQCLVLCNLMKCNNTIIYMIFYYVDLITVRTTYIQGDVAPRRVLERHNFISKFMCL